MSYLDQLTEKTKCTEGLSPAFVHKCKLGDETVYLKEIDTIYASTTYSVKSEAEVMKWLKGRVHVPQVIEVGVRDSKEYLIMSGIEGRHIESYVGDPLKHITYLAESVRELQKVDISRCPFCNDVPARLKELDYLLKQGLADINTDNWQDGTAFTDPGELYQWLCDNKPREELVLSHGDIGANLFVKDEAFYYYDLGRCGIADKWLDISFCVKDIRDFYPGTDYEKQFFEILGVEPDYEKINYFILLDELF